jgi:hypothetical protein
VILLNLRVKLPRRDRKEFLQKISSMRELRNKPSFFMQLVRPVGYPRWFVILQYGALFPIMLWPIMFFLSWFQDDRPNYLLFFLFNFYPVLIISLVAIAYRIFGRYRWLAVMLALLPILAMVLFAVMIFIALNYPSPNY